MNEFDIADHLRLSLQLRLHDPSLADVEAYRLFNGFYEGLPGLVIDVYGNTVVIKNHNRQPDKIPVSINRVLQILSEELPSMESVLLKIRHSDHPEERKSRFLRGDRLPDRIIEKGICYALDLRLHQDDSFYLDTRNLRAWLRKHSHRKRVLNFFAYTGSLGVAALAGGAISVLQTDSNSEFLSLAERSQRLNRLPSVMRVWASDYFKAGPQLKQAKSLFDIVILDAPFFSRSRFGEVDLQKDFVSLINKARPLVAHEGVLIVINNSLFVPGSQVIGEINQLSQAGYLSLEQTVEIPQDIRGYPESIHSVPPVDPAPFNHPTKISILRILRKDQAV